MANTANTTKLKIKKMRFSQPENTRGTTLSREETLDNATYPKAGDNIQICVALTIFNSSCHSIDNPSFFASDKGNSLN